MITRGSLHARSWARNSHTKHMQRGICSQEIYILWGGRQATKLIILNQSEGFSGGENSILGELWEGPLDQPRRPDSFQKKVKFEVSCKRWVHHKWRGSVMRTRRNSRCRGKEVWDQPALRFIPQVFPESLLGARSWGYCSKHNTPGPCLYGVDSW